MLSVTVDGKLISLRFVADFLCLRAVLGLWLPLTCLDLPPRPELRKDFIEYESPDLGRFGFRSSKSSNMLSRMLLQAKQLRSYMSSVRLGCQSCSASCARYDLHCVANRQHCECGPCRFVVYEVTV